MNFKRLKGTADVLPADSYKWQHVEKTLLETAALYGFSEIRFPVFEDSRLFQRSVGDTTDIVQKEMYRFTTKGGDDITLRPEGTAGAARAFLENGLHNESMPVKTCYLVSCYRYEKPQAGRMRELHQFGVEMFGAAEPAADAQVILLGRSIFERLGLGDDVQIAINSIGCPTCRAEYHKALKTYFTAHKDQLCETCNSRLERNPMRILDCKSPVCGEIAKGAPKILDYLCGDCRAHFEKVQSLLTAVGVEFTVDPGIVRGLDYYTRTVFEFISTRFGYALGGGGRYDGLVEEIGGKPTPALGFGLGFDRIMLALEEFGAEFPDEGKCELYIASMGEAAQVKAFELVNALHRCGVAADCDLCARGLKAQMKYADKIRARYTVVLGDNELESSKAELKNMKTGEKKKLSIGEDFIDAYLAETTAQDDLSF